VAVTTLSRLDGRVLLRGVLVALVVVGPAAALSIALVDTDGDDAGGPLGLLFFAVILVGFAIGGHHVGRTDVDLPITHGAFVGLVTFALVQGVILAVSSIGGREGDVSAAALGLSALIASAAGMIGATLGVRRGDWRS
jgi:hypothetical protein